MTEDHGSAVRFEEVYERLHELATAQMSKERAGHTLQPTALVHEVFLRLVDQSASWENQRHFFAAAAEAMRRILVDHARRRSRLRRGSDRCRVTIDLDDLTPDPDAGVDLLALDDALARLKHEDPRAAKIVQLRFFAGLSIADTARVLDLSPMTVKRSWSSAQAWLHGELVDEDAGGEQGAQGFDHR